MGIMTAPLVPLERRQRRGRENAQSRWSAGSVCSVPCSPIGPLVSTLALLRVPLLPSLFLFSLFRPPPPPPLPCSPNLHLLFLFTGLVWLPLLPPGPRRPSSATVEESFLVTVRRRRSQQPSAWRAEEPRLRRSPETREAAWKKALEPERGEHESRLHPFIAEPFGAGYLPSLSLTHNGDNTLSSHVSSPYRVPGTVPSPSHV